MDQIKITKVTETEKLKDIETLAYKIWKEHYSKIISEEQINYMLEKFQSYKSMQKQIQDGYEYYIILRNSKNHAGYFAVIPDNNALFLSKFYIAKEYRGQGIGGSAFNFIKDIATKKGLKSITLTVNKENSDSINIYKKLGFVITKELITDIGNGFVMDDYEFSYEHKS